MLPASYQLPAAIVLLLGGTVACFFGYRMFRLVLAIFGFIVGVFFSSSIVAPSDTTSMLVVGAIGGLIGAGILFAAYFVGVALFGAGIGALVANLAFSASGQEPHFLVIAFCAVAGAAVSMYLQRYVIILSTSFGGAWTMIVGSMALIGDRAAKAAVDNVWVLYPLNPAPDRQWLPIAWVVLGLIGTGVQLGWTGGEKGRVGRRRKSRKTD
ncbi:MAG TPA: DUF4203 domain-containing protein [Vicinamibacterales bacterium]|jgi:hypothetical protein|nr:DUF4203 domain-containing protein [Vicinamibacterales bacterium]